MTMVTKLALFQICGNFRTHRFALTLKELICAHVSRQLQEIHRVKMHYKTFLRQTRRNLCLNQQLKHQCKPCLTIFICKQNLECQKLKNFQEIYFIKFKEITIGKGKSCQQYLKRFTYKFQSTQYPHRSSIVVTYKNQFF